MKAILFHQHGDREVLVSGEVPPPVPGPDEAVIEVRAASINHLDIFVRRGIPGMRLPLPHIPGSDAAGVVTAVGDRVTRVKVGDAVVIDPGLSCGECRSCIGGEPSLCPTYKIMGEQFTGSYAQYVKMPARNLVPIPKGLSFTDAAALPLTLLTAWRMMIVRGQIQPVGVMAIQLAKMVGARVITTGSTAEKREKAKALGADNVLDPGQGPIDRAVRELTNRRGVDVVVDYVGKDTWVSSLKSLRKGGRLLTCGATTGYDPVEDLRHIFFRQLSVIGSTMGSRNDLEAGLAAVARGYVKPVVHAVLPLEAAKEGHRILEEREAFGKVVLVP
jgi:NADPH:quinone reductase-like Zn-dependent oxidoreductase